MNILLDIIGSAVVGGLVMLMIVGFRTNLSATAEAQCFNQSVQENFRTGTDVLESDFRKMGYRVTDRNIIRDSRDTTVLFRGDFNDDQQIDSIRYYLGGTTSSSTRNPRIRPLYRVVMLSGQTPKIVRFDVTDFQLNYYDRNGNLNPALQDIRSIKVRLAMESDFPVDSVWTGTSWQKTYSGVSWERVLRPKNVR
jgi:hypothetical protein